MKNLQDLSPRAKAWVCTSVDDLRSSLATSEDVATVREALAYCEEDKMVSKARLLRRKLKQLTNGGEK